MRVLLSRDAVPGYEAVAEWCRRQIAQGRPEEEVLEEARQKWAVNPAVVKQAMGMKRVPMKQKAERKAG